MQKKREGELMLAEFVYICILLFVSVPCDVLHVRACVRACVRVVRFTAAC